MKEKHNMITLPTGEVLINFRKFQQIGEHLSEIQQYQNMPYDILPNAEIQKQLKRLNPMKGYSDENTFQNYLITLKEQIEPPDSSSPRAFVSETMLKREATIDFISSLLVVQHTAGDPNLESLVYSWSRRVHHRLILTRAHLVNVPTKYIIQLDLLMSMQMIVRDFSLFIDFFCIAGLFLQRENHVRIVPIDWLRVIRLLSTTHCVDPMMIYKCQRPSLLLLLFHLECRVLHTIRRVILQPNFFFVFCQMHLVVLGWYARVFHEKSDLYVC